MNKKMTSLFCGLGFNTLSLILVFITLPPTFAFICQSTLLSLYIKGKSVFIQLIESLY